MDVDVEQSLALYEGGSWSCLAPLSHLYTPASSGLTEAGMQHPCCSSSSSSSSSSATTAQGRRC